MRRKKILALAAVWKIPDGIAKLTLTLTKEIYSPLMMLVIFGGMFVTAATALSSLQTKILATVAQPTTDEATLKRIDGLIDELIAQSPNRNINFKGVQKINDELTRIGQPAVQPLISAMKRTNQKEDTSRIYISFILARISQVNSDKRTEFC